MKNIKKISFLAVIGILTVAATTTIADDRFSGPGARHPNAGEAFRSRWNDDSPEAREAMKRRYEIMILMQAYKIAADDLKPGLKAEIIQRLTEDYIANERLRENMIVFLSAELERLTARQSANTPEEINALMEIEFSRLEAMPIDMRRSPDNRHLQGHVPFNE